MNAGTALYRRVFLKLLLGASLWPWRGARAEDIDSDSCGVTQAAPEGPFYVRNARETAYINYRNLPGRLMRVEGTVLGGPLGALPLPEARVEIWHADGDGRYHPAGDGDVSEYSLDAVNLRGVGYTDAIGRYAFHSIVPGTYGGRRRHIHWKFSAPGYRTLTTQSYWREDQGGAQALTDAVDRHPDRCRWLDFSLDRKGIQVGVFNVVLKPLQ
ncbi:hypothetical protein EUZ85_03370 [Hahella sp. KA22]|uniref:dioxygenase family protein n=1 Tax=Hahella sp. KA22 TaxID=1628392 RepID=UPI000FDE31E1|nr:hypothetical protein [Hahella sp. KA22]AZZ89796.1 hypothetical protein ENC22_00825 [Hahella sp. KA22]QAY53166.1 hypothetical protein EUZ85_03370 [Hahella sp. KA22]